MNWLNEFESTDFTAFRGPNLLVDEEDVQEPECLDAQNVEFRPGQVRTRTAFAEAFNPAAIVRYMKNWFQIDYNRLLYFNRTAGSLVSRILSSGAEENVLTSLAAGVTGMGIVEYGPRVLITRFGDDGQGAGNAKWWDGTFTSGVPNVEDSFTNAPLESVVDISVAETVNSGLSTAGTRYYGVLFNTVNGHTTPPGPRDGSSGIFEPRSLTAVGGKTYLMTITPASTFPNWIASAQVVMTDKSNPKRFYIVPGARVSIARGTGLPATIEFDMDDLNLLTHEEITDTILDQVAAPSWLGNIHKALPYGDRMVYLFRTSDPTLTYKIPSLAISDPGLPQTVSASESLLALPGYLDCMSAGVVGDILLVFGNGWTFAYADNRLRPVAWATARQVSDQIGTRWIHGVCPNSTKTALWVADVAGLWITDGSGYGRVPVSYEQTPLWRRINLSAPNWTLEVKDDPDNRLVFVKCALDAATTPSHLLVWDYTDGMSPDSIKFCGAWPITGYNLGSIEMVRNATTQRKELWVGSSSAAKVLRKKLETESTPYTDEGSNGIASYYRIGPLNRRISDMIQRFVAVVLRVRGAGSVTATCYHLDQTSSQLVGTQALSTAPGELYTFTFNRESEAQSVQVATDGSAGSYFILSLVRTFFKGFGRRKAK